MTTSRCAPFSTTVWVIDGVHGATTHLGTTAEPTAPTCLTDGAVLVSEVADLANGSPALLVHVAKFTRGQAEKDMLALLGHDLSVAPGAAAQLAASSGGKLDVVDPSSQRNRHQPHGVAWLDVRIITRDDGVAHLEVDRVQDVPLLAVHEVDQRDASGAVRIVLDRRDLAGNTDLVTLEVDDPVPRL